MNRRLAPDAVSSEKESPALRVSHSLSHCPTSCFLPYLSYFFFFFFPLCGSQQLDGIKVLGVFISFLRFGRGIRWARLKAGDQGRQRRTLSLYLLLSACPLMSHQQPAASLVFAMLPRLLIRRLAYGTAAARISNFFFSFLFTLRKAYVSQRPAQYLVLLERTGGCGEVRRDKQ
ncbi:hypothetical protein B0J12DRAFT_119952 [Macrophomina phaseolina]|uniref:Transmembrane protein n=1 Tax=Macrophomina phaseolina TaxID=35725 RepID=A0ABQ8G7K6_9PEZI|nr:hypothetical protein B0J12DRAFT_119952 [Macrophomina phaseolina]